MRTHQYAASVSWQGSTKDYRTYARDHRATAHGAEIPLSADPAFRGNAELWNPELMLVAAASSCQLLSFLAVAAHAGVDVIDYQDDARGFMPSGDGPVSITRVALRPRIQVRGADPGDVVSLVQRAHDECYIANSLRCEISVEPTVTVA